MKAIGIDIGTTNISGVVWDQTEGKMLVSKMVSSDCFLSGGPEWERTQDVSVILSKARTLLDELLTDWPEVKTIGLTGQMHGILYLNAKGEAVSPLYTWQDGRGDQRQENGLSLVEQIRQKQQLPVATGYGLVTHIYNKIHNLVPESAVSICTIMDYVGMALTGREKPLIHASNGASLGFFDGENLRFQEEKLKEWGVDCSVLPELASDGKVLGYYQGRLITVALGDNQAGFLGAAGMEPGTALVNMGTGGQISLLSDKYVEAPGIEARPFMAGQYLLVGASLCGGRAYAILEGFLRSYAVAAGAKDQSQYEVMARLAEKAEGEMLARLGDVTQPAEVLLVNTTFQGTRQDPALRGSILNISDDNFTPEHLIYGVLEGMAQELYGFYETMCQSGMCDINRLVGSGNGLRMNPVLQRIFERKFRKELELADCQEEAACGAAIWAKRN